MNQASLRMDWRRWLLLAVFILLTIWVFSRFTDLKGLFTILSEGYWPWVVAGILLHVAYFLMSAELYQLCFATVGVESNVWQLLPVMFSAFFINVVVPSGGAAGGALFVGDAIHRGQSGARAALGTVLVLLIDLATLIPFLIWGIVYLAVQKQIHVYDTVTSAFFCIFVFLMAGGLVLARQKPGVLRLLFGWVRRLVNWVAARFKRPDLLAQDWGDRNAAEFGAAAEAIATHPRKLGWAMGWAFLMHVVNLIGLYALFLAFRQSVPLGALVAGFAMGIVIWVISIVPQGIAAVEGIMALVFTSTGVPADKTAAIVLAFRGVNFYLPLIFGFFLVRRVGRFARGVDPSSRNEATTDSGQVEQHPEQESG